MDRYSLWALIVALLMLLASLQVGNYMTQREITHMEERLQVLQQQQEK